MEEIICCKDCKFREWKCTYVCGNKSAPWNSKSKRSAVFVEEDDFCSYAEPKEYVSF